MRSLTTAMHNIRRSPYQSTAAVLLMSLVFFMSFVLAMFILGATQVLEYFESRPKVVAYFSKAATGEQVQKAKEAMQSKSYVAEVKVISKEEGLTLFKEINKDDPVFLEFIDADALPVSLEVSAKEITSLPQIKDDLSGLSGIEDLNYQRDIIETLTKVVRYVRIVGLIIISFLLFISMMFIMVVLSLRVALKRQEISIMRLLGAGVSYIVWPYMMEGIIYAVLGSIIGWLAMFILYLYTLPALVLFFQSVIHFPVSWMVFAGLLGSGVLVGASLGIWASFLAVSRFIKR